ncbi:GR25 family glycosyltransferase involved in LPS biosynthesis [Hoeflea marina]|uniref:GR25 family glycosyltransferase involved in LPS biosynthesis n=2 Tax=Hoeflea marina TaxID=274592 RepID=A0A317PRX7_9HYPH|nr:GR25 family glycosyltransferase involved in LPS biosynthesis [Hoeflea marina]
MILPVLVAILTCSQSSPERVTSARAQAEALFAQENITLVDGMVASDKGVDDLYDSRLGLLRSKRRPTRQEIAVYGTHRMAWTALLASSHDYALVLEDDFRVIDAKTVVDCLNNLADLMGGNRNLVKLFDFPRHDPVGAAIATTVKAIRLVKWARPRAGMVAYFISRQGAERYLTRGKVFRAVDEDIKYYWELGLDVWSVPGNAVVDGSAELGGSLVEQSRLGSKRRSISRSLHGLMLNISRDVMNWRAFERYRARHGYETTYMQSGDPEG